MLPDVVDVVVVGSGAAGLTAACVAATEGATVAVVESSEFIGGTTAISGGMVWIPANHKMKDLGIADDSSQAIRYLQNTVDGLNAELASRYIKCGDDAIRYLEKHTSLRLRPVPSYPDYYPVLPGATGGGRVLEPVPFDGRILGNHFKSLRAPLKEYTLFGGMMISREDIPHLRRVGRSFKSTWYTMRLMARYAGQRLVANRGTSLYLGNALAARLYKSALDLQVILATNTTAERLIKEDGRVVGIEGVHQGNKMAIRARKGVILATGGVSHDSELRPRYVPVAAGSLTATVGSQDNVSGASLAKQADAALTEPTPDGALWVPVSRFVRPDGTPAVFPHTVSDRAKPGLIAVNRHGQRFVNEALSYHEFVKAQLNDANNASRAWLVVNHKFLWKYGLGRVRPFSVSVSGDIASGYLHKGRDIPELAVSIGVSPSALDETIRQYNLSAHLGEDPQFHKGSDIYQRHLGDADQRPNPCVAPLDTGPYYAVAVEPADLGMAAGVVADAQGRALLAQGDFIPGLYVCGNDRESFMNGAYPGPGITLGPAITLAYLAARDCVQR